MCLTPGQHKGLLSNPTNAAAAARFYTAKQQSELIFDFLTELGHWPWLRHPRFIRYPAICLFPQRPSKDAFNGYISISVWDGAYSRSEKSAFKVRPWSDLVLTRVFGDPITSGQLEVRQVTPGMRMRLEWPLVIGSHFPALYANNHVHHLYKHLEKSEHFI